MTVTSLTDKPTILVTGGAGYIGSHAILALQQAGYQSIILDNLIYGHRELVENVLQVPLIVGDISDRALLADLFATYNIAAVMHFAAFAYVGESMKEPVKYYRNNVGGTRALLESMLAASVKRLVFSSTCATYGIPQSVPISENDPQIPINPYGASKLMVERMLHDFNAAYGLQSVIFRYFNAAGADAAGRLGEDHTPEPHLIPRLLLAALGKRDSFTIFGTDYPTPDGTCVRDYIHVADIAQAHVLGLEYLLQGGHSTSFNLGNGTGFSVRQVIDTVSLVTGKAIDYQQGERRQGDPPVLISSSERARTILGWQPQYPAVADAIRHAWYWHQRRHGSS